MKIQVCFALRCEEFEVRKQKPDLHLFKQPTIAIAARDFKAKELRLCFSTPTVSLQANPSSIWVGDFEYQNRRDTPIYVAPYFSFAEGAEFIAPSAFVTCVSEESKANMKVEWTKVDNVSCPSLINPKPVAKGDRLHRLSAEVGVGTCPPKILERQKKLKAEKANAAEKKGEAEAAKKKGNDDATATPPLAKKPKRS